MVNTVSTLDDDAPSGNQARRTQRRTRQRRGDLQEQAILDAAERLLHEHRFADLTVGKVAAAAAISRPGVYFYFGSMEEILTALVTVRLSTLTDLIDDLEAGPDATPREVLGEGIERIAGAWRAHGTLFRTVVEQLGSIPAVYAQWRAAVDQAIEMYVLLAGWAASLAGRSEPDEPALRRRIELCMFMEGMAFTQLSIRGHDSDEEAQLKVDLVDAIAKVLELDG